MFGSRSQPGKGPRRRAGAAALRPAATAGARRRRRRPAAARLAGGSNRTSGQAARRRARISQARLGLVRQSDASDPPSSKPDPSSHVITVSASCPQRGGCLRLNFPAVIREIDRISIVRAMSSALDALRGSSVCPLRSNTGHNQRAAAERRFVPITDIRAQTCSRRNSVSEAARRLALFAGPERLVAAPMARRLYAVGEGVGLPPESGSAHRYSGRCPLRAGDHHALSCLPCDVFDADLGERRSNGRPSSVRPSGVLCESQRRLLSVYG